MADYNYDNRKSYNNRELTEGYALVPIYVTWEMVTYYHMDPNNLETWDIQGHKVLVAFDIIEKERKDTAIKIFWTDVRDHLKMNRIDPMLCSYESLTEADAEDHYGNDKSYEPKEVPSLERTALLAQIIDELVEEVRRLDPECGSILDMIKAGLDNKQIIEALGYGKSYGYSQIKKANQTARKLYYKD